VRAFRKRASPQSFMRATSAEVASGGLGCGGGGLAAAASLGGGRGGSRERTCVCVCSLLLSPLEGP